MIAPQEPRPDPRRGGRDVFYGILVVCAIVVLAAVLFACGGSDEPAGNRPTDKWSTVMDGNLKFRCFTIWRENDIGKAGGPAIWCYQVDG